MTNINIKELIEKQDFTLDELKFITTFVVNEVINEKNILINFRLMTIKEYYSSELFKSLLMENNGILNAVLTPFTSYAFISENTIVLFYDVLYKKVLMNKYCLIDVIQIVFHEITHSIYKQKKEELSLYCRFIDILENDILYSNYNHYLTFWNKYYKEAVAELYSMIITENFLKQFPEYYLKNKNYIDKKKAEKQLMFDTYDFNFIFNKFNKIRKKKLSVGDKVLFDGTIYKSGSNEISNISTLANLFDEDNNKEILYSILSSEVFIKNLKLDLLSDKELVIMENAVNYAYSVEVQKNLCIKQYFSKYNNFKLIYHKILYDIDNRINYLERMSNILKTNKKKYLLKKTNNHNPYNC